MHQLQIVFSDRPSFLYGLFENLFNTPSLSFTQWPAFLYENRITDIAGVLRVVGKIFNACFHILAIEFMSELALYTDDDTFFHSIADNRTGPSFLDVVFSVIIIKF